jgi:crossover junction endodeoxyribonuclease RuvC
MSSLKKAKKAKPGKATTGLQLPENVNYLLGLDLSLNSTGFCQYRLDTKEMNYGIIDSDGRRGMERLDHIAQTIRKLAAVGQDGIRPLAVIENFAFARPNQAHQIGELHGVVRYELWRNHVPFILVAPLQLKKWIIGKGQGEKDLILKELYKRYDFDVSDDNIADAVGLMLIGKTLLGKYEKPLVQFQQEVISKMLEGAAA